MPADVHESKLVLHWPGRARTFNPFSNLPLPSWFPVWFVFDQLVHLDADAQVVPQLAERWDVSDDGRRYVFHLRDGVTWHDGEPFTAADVAFTYTMPLDPRAGSRYQSLALPVRGAEEYARGEAASVAGLDAIDDRTIAFELAQPHFGFLATMGFPIVSQHVLGDIAEDDEVDATEFALTSLIGTGPFRLVAHVPEGDAELVANPSYWGGSPLIDWLILRRLDDEEALLAFERGEIDIMFIGSTHFVPANTEFSWPWAIDTLTIDQSIMLAIELYEAGVINDGDLDGLRLEWGNTEAILEVMDAIVHKRGFGEILALGPGKMLGAIGRGAEAYPVDYKNGLVAMELGPDLRGLKHTNTFGRLINPRGSHFDMYRFPRLGKIPGLEEASITEQIEAMGPHSGVTPEGMDEYLEGDPYNVPVAAKYEENNAGSGSRFELSACGVEDLRAIYCKTRDSTR